MSKRNFKDKRVLITGASGNLGKALCLELGKAGAVILALDLHQDSLIELTAFLEAHSIKVWAKNCDITNQAQLADCIAEARGLFGPIDVLVNNAGITHIKRLERIENPSTVLRSIIDVNFFGATNCTELLLEDLIQQKGLIINISSVAGFAPLIGRTAYAASKHALHGYFESLRAELYEKEVHCLMVCPSFIGLSEVKSTTESPAENSIYQKKKILGKTISPAFIAQKIRLAAQDNQKTLVLGKTAKIAYFFARFFPSFYEQGMRKRLKDEG